MSGVAGVPESAERLNLDLANSLSGEAEVLADFFECAISLLLDSVAHFQNLLLSQRQRSQHQACFSHHGCIDQTVCG